MLVERLLADEAVVPEPAQRDAGSLVEIVLVAI